LPSERDGGPGWTPTPAPSRARADTNCHSSVDNPNQITFKLTLAQAPAFAASLTMPITAPVPQEYAEKYDKWRMSLVSTLKQKFRYDDDHLFVLAETEGPNVAKSTRSLARRP
jgi:hypothetical protein